MWAICLELLIEEHINLLFKMRVIKKVLRKQKLMVIMQRETILTLVSLEFIHVDFIHVIDLYP